MTVLLITHHMDECVNADRVIVISDGEIALDGTPGEVFSQVEIMRSLGLDVPATTETLWELRRAGIDVPLTALTEEDCVRVLAALCDK